MKKVLTLLLAFVMVFALAAPAFAEESDPTYPGEITIQNATMNKWYAAYKLFDLTNSGNKVAYTFTKTATNTDLYNKLVEVDPDSTTDPKETKAPFTLSATSDPNVYNVVMKDTASDADVINYIRNTFFEETDEEYQLNRTIDDEEYFVYADPDGVRVLKLNADPEVEGSTDTYWVIKERKLVPWVDEVYDAEDLVPVMAETLKAKDDPESGNPYLTPYGEPVQAKSDTVVINDAPDGLPLGYYFLTSSLGTTLTINSTLPKVTVIDKNEEDDWDSPKDDDPGDEKEEPDDDNVGKVIIDTFPNTDVAPICGKTEGKDHTHDDYCYPRNKERYVTKNSVNYGEDVNFEIAIQGTQYKGTELVTYYHIIDTLDDGFDGYEDVVVTIKETDGTVKTLTAGTDYTYKEYNDGNSFDICIPFVKSTANMDGETIVDYTLESLYSSNPVITVTYKSTVTTDAVIAGDGNKNVASYYAQTLPQIQGHDPFDPDEPEWPVPPTPDKPVNPDNPSDDDPYFDKFEDERETSTYVFALGIVKVDQDGVILKGAEFSITNGYGDTISGVKVADGVYRYPVEGDTDTVTQFKTDDNGKLTFKGLEGIRYYVQEEVAPEGYNVLKDPVVMEPAILQSTTYGDTITIYYDKAEGEEDRTMVETVTEYKKVVDFNDIPIVPYKVINKAGVELPQTGGMGTTIFYVIGSILVLGAAVLLITRRRVSA